MSVAYTLLGLLDVLDSEGRSAFPIVVDPASGSPLSRYFDETLLTAVSALHQEHGSPSLTIESLAKNATKIWLTAGCKTVGYVEGEALSAKVRTLVGDLQSDVDQSALRLISVLDALTLGQVGRTRFLFAVE